MTFATNTPRRRGAVWAWLYHRSGSLLGPWLGHMLVEAAIFAAGYQLVF